ncbi:MAG: proteasome accessory factor PafA2 family protein [Candidatus Taylorbacteria bacterium]|nr:proteasome accessory factor PafA2 family protein [Candidatus Taylorbacteria bacterium]
MDTTLILKKLESGGPLFTAMPVVGEKRICGTESELAPSNKAWEPAAQFERLPLILQNGGEVYEDRGHIEYASPECSNAASLVAYYEAGKMFCWRAQLSEKLYCHNNDWRGNTFGAHENYFTRAPRKEWFQLLPFLIARNIVCGVGWINDKGEFEISQRAKHITCAMSDCTTDHRAVINLRPEPLAEVKGWDRLHLICGDATMSEVSTFLRIGMTSLVIEMLEMGALPHIQYKSESAADDFKAVSRKTDNWHLAGVTKGPQEGLEVLRLYLERAKQLFSHRDEVTRTLLVIWQDTLNQLASDPMKLWRRLDWVAKLLILITFQDWEAGSTAEWLKSQDMEYHNLNPQEGLYHHLRQMGEVERIVSDELIVHAAFEPPSDTRAYVRGKISQHLAAEGDYRSLCANGWDHLTVVDKICRGHDRYESDNCSYLSERTDNPFETYANLVEKIKNRLDGLKQGN